MKTKKRKKWEWAWVKDRYRPVMAKRQIRRGRNKGDYEITLPDGKKQIVPVNYVRQ